MRAVKSAEPDGNTLLMSPIAPMSIYQSVHPSLEYDPIRDFQPISQLAEYEFGVAVSNEIPVQTLAELVAWMKANPARANYRTPADIVARMNAIVVAALAKPEIRARFRTLGVQPTGTSPEALAKIQHDDIARWAPAVKASGFVPSRQAELD